ncbi:MAG: excinuclease ABC subunit UvrC [Candidatus Sumerlaeota bacterium]
MNDQDNYTTSSDPTGSYKLEELGEIPRQPGVYMMFDERGKVLYVGKAVNLRNRVRQYFAKSPSDNRWSVPKIQEYTRHIETILTNTEKEAFLLENHLIKRHRPQYNVRLRDDKTYVSVRIDTKEDWPRADVMRRRKQGKSDKAVWFGPYSNAYAIRQTMAELQKIFPLRSCSDTVFRNRSRPCLLHQIGRCCAPCVGKVSREQYAEYVRHTIQFLKGNTQELLDSLTDEMAEYSRNMEYEKAAVLRDRIEALKTSSERQRVSIYDARDRDIIGYEEEQGQAGLALMIFRRGQLIETETWVVPVFGEPRERTIAQFIGQYYEAGRIVPPEIFLPAPAEDSELIEDWLSDLREGRVKLSVPLRGEKRKLVELAQRNAEQVLRRKITGKAQAENLLADLARRLKLSEPPRRIECYDIATMQGTLSAGSRVVFTDGEPDKSQYRLYKIRNKETQDDFAMMQEVLERHFRRSIETNEEALPDLVIVDGGKGQLSSAVAILEEVGASNVPIAALAKSHIKEETDAVRNTTEAEGGPAEGYAPEGKVRTAERLFVPGRKNPISFPPRAPSFYLLQRIRDEAHRFVNTYHAKRRRSTHLRSSLEDIPGVGAGRAKALLRHFGSLKRLKDASPEAIAEVKSITSRLAQDVYDYFHDAAADDSEE